MGAQEPDWFLRFEAMKFRQQLSVWSARLWLAASTARPTMPDCVKETFFVAGIPTGASHLHDLLTIICVSTRHMIHFKQDGCSAISADEARYLALLASASHGNTERCIAKLLEHWLPPAAARLAVQPARGLAHSVFVQLAPPIRLIVSDRESCDTSRRLMSNRGISLLH